jgi:hypothetical protein
MVQEPPIEARFMQSEVLFHMIYKAALWESHVRPQILYVNMHPCGILFTCRGLTH